jgi:hypothetical protein
MDKASEHKSFIFGDTLKKQLEKMPADVRLKFFEAIMAYGLEREEIHFDGLEAVIWEGMKDAIDNFGGKNRGGQYGNKNAAKQKNESETNETNKNDSPNVNVNVKDNGNGNVNTPSKDSFHSFHKKGAFPDDRNSLPEDIVL